ncbi:hypothetical protein [Nocardioides sp. KR10-350]|uniref:hypothetical protein n=1 Tax=Nocardioides cheoyonin TaxID=3156615 RepID=UPI0032B4FB36
MPFKGLDQRQTFTLIMEVDEAVALANCGLRSLAELHHIDEEYAAVLTLLSIASEKLLKTVIGLAELDAGRSWPTVKVMKDYGHHITRLDRDARRIYSNQLDRAAAPPYLTELLADCEAGNVLTGMLDALEHWADRGRFHRLDELAGKPQPGETAQAMWQALENQVAERDTELAAMLGTVERYDQVRDRINHALRESYLRWWQLHWRAWAHGVIGDDACGLSVALGRLAGT